MLDSDGVGWLRNILAELTIWMEENEYSSIRQMQGSMSMRSVGDPAAFERANYMKVSAFLLPVGAKLTSRPYSLARPGVERKVHP